MLGKYELLWTVAEVLTGLRRDGIGQIASKIQLLDAAHEPAAINTVP